MSTHARAQIGGVPTRGWTRPAIRDSVPAPTANGAPLSDRGSISVWVAIVVPALLLLSVLLIDGGAKIQAANRADSTAAEAARAAVIASGPRPDTSADPRAAAGAARSYLARAGMAGQVTILSPGQVKVTVTAAANGPITGIGFAVTRSATAQLLVGVERGERP